VPEPRLLLAARGDKGGVQVDDQPACLLIAPGTIATAMETSAVPRPTGGNFRPASLTVNCSPGAMARSAEG